MTSTLAAVHLAGNCAVDLVFQCTGGDRSKDGRSPSKVQFLDSAPETQLAGNAGWPAYLLAKMQHRVQLNTKIGTDLFGTFLRARLGEAGVELVGPDANSTPLSMLPLVEGGVNSGNLYPGEPIDWLASLPAMGSLADAAWFFASGYSGVGPADATSLNELFGKLQQQEVKTVFDPSPWFAGRVGQEEMLKLFSKVHCLCGTLSELGHWYTEKDPAQLSERILESGVQLVVLKKGSEGASFASAGGESGNVPTTPIPGAYAVAAGDTFNAGLLHGLSTGMPLSDSVAYAVSIATELVKVGRGSFVLPT